MCGIGDIVFLARALAHQKNYDPSFCVDLVTKRPASELAQKVECIDKVYEIEKSSDFCALVGRQHDSWDAILPLGSAEASAFNSLKIDYQRLLELNEFFRSRMGAFGSQVWFYDRPPGLIYDRLHVTEVLCDLLGCDRSVDSKVGYIEGISDQDKAAEEAICKLKFQCNKIIGFNTGSNWLSKQWGLENYCDLSIRLRKHGWGIVYFGDELDHLLVDRNVVSGKNELNICGYYSAASLPELVSKCDLIISGDTGVAHVADSLEVPLVVLFGPTANEEYGPLSKTSVAPFEDQSCKPCHSRNCRLARNESHCLTRFDVSRIYSIALAMLV